MIAIQRDKKERRLHPRFSTAITVSLQIESGDEVHELESLTKSISLNTIQLEGDSGLMAVFQAQHQYPHPCKASFTLPSEEEPIDIECHMVTHRRLSQHVYYLSLSITGFADEQTEEKFKNALLEMKVSGVKSFLKEVPKVQQIKPELDQRQLMQA